MTYYTVTYYCNDELVTMYTSTKEASGGNAIEAAAVVFQQLPKLPPDIAGVFVSEFYLH